MVASDKLKSVQSQMGQEQLKVKKDIVTRWNSVFYMLQRLQQIKEALSAALVSLPGSPMALTIDEWAVIEDCVMLLKPMELMTAELSGQKYPTLSLIIPLVRGIQINLNSKTPKTTAGISLKENLLSEINKRLGQVEKMELPSSATSLDPRFKKAAFGVEGNAKKAKKFVVDQLSSRCQSQRNTEDVHDTVSLNGNPSATFNFLDTKVIDHVSKTNANILL